MNISHDVLSGKACCILTSPVRDSVRHQNDNSIMTHFFADAIADVYAWAAKRMEDIVQRN
ncbi:MAG: hypothetical protein HYU74_07635 [Dechloromonas sp.]|nr:hypothetical protein [Dechloromonas sp.]